MLKCPPLALSSRRQKMDGESKSGLSIVSSLSLALSIGNTHVDLPTHEV